MMTTDTLERFRVEPDTDSESPRTWDDSVQILMFRGANVEECEDTTGPLATFFHVQDVYVVDGQERDRIALRAAQHWANVYGNGEHVTTRTIRGYSQSDWWDCVAVGPDSVAVAGALDEFGQWLRGDVWVVAREVGEECNLGHVHWTVADSLAGIYADSEAEAIAQFREDN